MLPDYPIQKERLKKVLINRMKKVQTDYAPHLAQVPRIRIFEGDRWVFERADGTVSESRFQKMESQIKINLRELEDISPEDILKKIDVCAEEIARQQWKLFHEKVDAATKSAGTVVDGQGRPFSVDLLLELLEKIEMDFDPTGEPDLPTIFAGPKLAEAIKKALPQLKSNPVHKRRFEEIISKKREDWRARQSSRKLVG